MYIYIYIYGFPEMGIPQNEWFIMGNPIKIDDLGVPPSREMPIYIYISTGNELLSIDANSQLS